MEYIHLVLDNIMNSSVSLNRAYLFLTRRPRSVFDNKILAYQRRVSSSTSNAILARCALSLHIRLGLLKND
jgi:hypothetical protein